jgi:transposase
MDGVGYQPPSAPPRPSNAEWRRASGRAACQAKNLALDDGRICLSNNAAERALRSIALGRRAWLFAGSDRGGERAAAIYTLIAAAKLNGIDPQAWLADVLRRIADHPASRLHELLCWHWIKPEHQAAAA